MNRTVASDVLIVGGGIAGLSLAGYLARQGYTPTIAEQATEWRDGYGIGLWESGLDVLAELEVLDRARTLGVEPDGFEVRGNGGERLTSKSLSPGERFLLLIRRSGLHRALREPIPDEWISMDTTPERITERSDTVSVTFADGTTEEYDFVVGADGVHSTVRNQCFDQWQCIERDTYVWYLWDQQDVGIDYDMVSVWGPNCEGFIGRINGRVGFNLAHKLDTPPSQTDTDHLARAVDKVGWKLPELLDAADSEPVCHRVFESTSERWHTDRVVLLGDAAHAVHPVSGMGASLALRDARTLAQELATASDHGLSEALERFEQRRRGDVRHIRLFSRLEARMSFIESERLRALRNRLVSIGPVVQSFLSLQRLK